jgi:hypothetical protein
VARRFPFAVHLALEKVVGVNFRDFFWKFKTGRLAKDYEIMLLLGARNLGEAFRGCGDYLSWDRDALIKLDMRELLEKKYLNNAAIGKARKIKSLMSKPLIGKGVKTMHIKSSSRRRLVDQITRRVVRSHDGVKYGGSGSAVMRSIADIEDDLSGAYSKLQRLKSQVRHDPEAYSFVQRAAKQVDQASNELGDAKYAFEAGLGEYVP